jgi:hypothetical protein
MTVNTGGTSPGTPLHSLGIALATNALVAMVSPYCRAERDRQLACMQCKYGPFERHCRVAATNQNIYRFHMRPLLVKPLVEHAELSVSSCPIGQNESAMDDCDTLVPGMVASRICRRAVACSGAS